MPGTIRRSHSIHGVAEALIKSKRYLIPLIILDPEVTGAIVATYLVDGRLSLPSKVRVYEAGEIFDPAYHSETRTSESRSDRLLSLAQHDAPNPK